MMFPDGEQNEASNFPPTADAFLIKRNVVTNMVTSIGYRLVTVGYSIGYKRWLHHASQIAQTALQKTQSGSSHGYENIAYPVRSWCDSKIPQRGKI